MHTTSVRRRAALLGVLVTLGAAALVRLVAGPAAALARDPAGDFPGLLVQACAVLALLATALLVGTTWSTVAGQLRRPGAPTHPVGPVRVLLLALCGVAVLAGPASARPDPPAPTSLAGLPLPDRPAGTAESPRTVLVRPGDSLWAISARALGPGASEGDVASYGRRVHALNVEAVGADPDLLHPGQRLRLPAHRERR